MRALILIAALGACKPSPAVRDAATIRKDSFFQATEGPTSIGCEGANWIAPKGVWVTYGGNALSFNSGGENHRITIVGAKGCVIQDEGKAP